MSAAHPIIETGLDELSSTLSLSEIKDSKILISGGVGFLGSWLCDILLRKLGKVTCVDDFSTGLETNISHISENKDFTLLKEDITKTNELDGKYQYILHLASIASPDAYQVSPTQTLLSNSLGTLNLLEEARKGDSTFLYASTSEIYGDPSVIPTPEDYWGYTNPIGIRSCYDEAKRFGEALVMAYYRQYGLDIRIVRIFNTYGPRLRADGIYARAVSKFISQVISDENLTVYGDGSQTRSFTYVTDTIDGILRTLTSNLTKGEVLNLGNPQETNILELAKIIRKLARSSSRITYGPLPLDDPKRRKPDIAKAKKLLGWEPKILLEEGLMNTISWYRNNL